MRVVVIAAKANFAQVTTSETGRSINEILRAAFRPMLEMMLSIQRLPVP
jgi:hypothetical protein